MGVGEQSMKLTYDPQADVLRITLHPHSDGTPEPTPQGITLSHDEAGRLTGLEIRGASQRIEPPLGFGIPGFHSNR